MIDKTEYRPMAIGEEQAVFSLVELGFNGFVRKDLSQEGIDEFMRAARVMVYDHPPDHFITVAANDGQVVGMIDMRGGYQISLFFVDPSHQGQGIGRCLLDHAISKCCQLKPDIEEIKVHSSVWAVPIYEKLGFKQTNPMQEENGIRFVALIKELKCIL